MAKKQQMRWSEKGAHLLIQIRTRVLNDELQDVFRFQLSVHKFEALGELLKKTNPKFIIILNS